MPKSHEPSFTADSDRFTRRSILRAGGLALSASTLGEVLRARAESPAGARTRPKSVIMIHLSGGPSHLDMYDMKPAAPSGYRGEFKTIPTNVPGMEICELMPAQAKIADKFAILRGVFCVSPHTANEFYSGYPWQESPRAPVPGEGQRPALGSVVSRLRGGGLGGTPPYVSLHNKSDWERAYYLGVGHEPFRVGSGDINDTLENLKPSLGVNAQRLESRKDLHHNLDILSRDLDRAGTIKGLDAFQARALEIIASGKVRNAFDVASEPEHVRARYGRSTGEPHWTAPGPLLLQARRLVEAGVSVVTVCPFGAGPWDTHRANFSTLRKMLPPLDQALAALVVDLEQRGLLDDVAVLMGGEFGRTPRIGDQSPDGRGHWPVGFLWVAGGGLKTGQIIGATDARGEQVVGNPIRMQNVLTTMYHVLGIDPATTFTDQNGRPLPILDDREPVRALL